MNTATAEKQNKIMYISQAENFSKIPGRPIAYWVSNILFEAFAQWRSLEQQTICAAGVSSGNNDVYLKLWFEIPLKAISFSSVSDEMFQKSLFTYVPCNKGGGYRKWYGNNEYVAQWKRSNEFHRNGSTYKELLFKEGMSWSAITTYKFSGRYYKNGYIFDHASPSLFTNSKEQLLYFIALTNSSVGQFILSVINPTMNTGADSLRKIPVDDERRYMQAVVKVSNSCVELSENDWDSFETSWDFKKHPLI